MDADVRNQVKRRFLKDTEFYKVVMDKINAENFVADIILWNLNHKGNVVVEIEGRQRHGKSTVGRFFCVILTAAEYGQLKGWEARVLYSRQYSRMTKLIMQMVKDWEDEGKSEEEILVLIRHHIFMMDEVFIEHEKDSVKALDDLKNLLNTVSRAQIHFIFITPRKRNIGAYFSIWVVGYNPLTQENLCFVYDSEGVCVGYMVTPRILETEKYELSKNEGIYQLLKDGGRVPADAKIVDEEGVPTSSFERKLRRYDLGDWEIVESRKSEVRDDLIPLIWELWQDGNVSIPKSKKMRDEHASVWYHYYTSSISSAELADQFHVSKTALTNSYQAGGWLAIFNREVAGYLCEEAIRRLYYPEFIHQGGKGHADLLHADGRMVEVKLKRTRETPRLDMLSAEETQHPELVELVMVTLNRRGSNPRAIVEFYRFSKKRVEDG